MISFYKKHNHYSYGMGISTNIMALKQEGFLIKKIGSDYFVSFSQEKDTLWEAFIESNLKENYWNEYITDDKVVFLFKFNGKIERYEVYNFDSSEVLQLCESLCEQKFASLQTMLEGNKYYKKVFKKLRKNKH